MFEDLEEKTVGEVREEVKKLAKDFMEDVDEVITTIIVDTKAILSRNKDDLIDIAEDLNDIGGKLPKDTISDILDAIVYKLQKK